MESSPVVPGDICGDGPFRSRPSKAEGDLRTTAPPPALLLQFSPRMGYPRSPRAETLSCPVPPNLRRKEGMGVSSVGAEETASGGGKDSRPADKGPDPPSRTKV